ncbi:MAG: phosphatidylserine/phosphatidylglycerophosphate/cardiolipin synthase family protein [Cryobacterium sp.]|nr:phosphatidylserine/phosphatidylglycerophosphate/cardiolipin synthase family protein [Oligoflexia bacterium]
MRLRRKFLTLASAAILVLGFNKFARADVYRILNNPNEAFQARIDLIQHAKVSIDLSYYAWSDDLQARQILGLLKEAAEVRHVKVQLIVDAGASHISPATRLYLASFGVQVREYLPFRILFPNTWFHSMHVKFMVVDQETLLMGGRNMEAGYFELPAKNLFQDRDVIIQGEAVEEASKYFRDLWNSDIVYFRIRALRGESVEDAGDKIARAAEQLSIDAAWCLNSNFDWTRAAHTDSKVHFIHDQIGQRKFHKRVGDEIYALMDRARESITIETAYLTVNGSFLRVLKRAVDRGVHIRILTNSLASNDVLTSQAGYLARRRTLIRMGIELWEYSGDRTFHIKSSIIDNHVSVIGSFNLDPISRDLNAETISYVEDPEIAQELRIAMDDNLKWANQIGHDGKPMGKSSRFPGVPWTKVAKMQLLRYLVVPILRGLL